MNLSKTFLSAVVVSTLALSAAPVLAEEGGEPCEGKACACHHDDSPMGKVKAFLMKRDEVTGTPRAVRIGAGVAGVAVMVTGATILGTTVAAISIVPACAQNPGACRTAMMSPVRDNAFTAIMSGTMPGPSAANR